MKKSLLALASGTLGLGIAEFVMMGILPDVAHDLDISIPQAGHFISAYAVGVCVGAPLMVVVARTRPLKQILLGLTAIYLFGNLCASMSSGYLTLLLMRFVSGLPHGAFFGVASIVAEKVADKGKESQAVAFMIAGMTIANLFGVPLGTMLSNAISWRLPFIFNALWGIGVFGLIWKWIPSLPSLSDTSLKDQFRFLSNPGPWLIILTTMFGNGGVFCWFSYVTPQMIHEAGFIPAQMTLIMMLAGLGMTIGNLVGGKCGDLYGLAPVIQFTQIGMILALVGTFFFAGVPWLAVVLMFVATSALFAVSPPQQLLLLQNSRRCEMMGAACVQIAFNLGNALGAYVGGLPIEMGLGYRYPALAGAFVVLVGLICVSVYVRHDRKVVVQAR